MKIDVKVAGVTGTGKTTIALIIHKALQEAGFKTCFIEAFDEGDSNRTDIHQTRCIKTLQEKDLMVSIEQIPLRKSNILSK